jgi:hypothetical protein
MAKATKVVINDVIPVVEKSITGLRITRPYGFQDEFGDCWFWNLGSIVRNPYVIGILLNRKAPVEEI